MDQRPGDYRDAIAAQLAAIGARLNSILVTMKNDVEAIKNQIILHTTFEPDDCQSQLPKHQEIKGDEDDGSIPNVNSHKDDGPIQITLRHPANGAEVLNQDHVIKDPQVVGEKTVPNEAVGQALAVGTSSSLVPPVVAVWAKDLIGKVKIWSSGRKSYGL